MIDVKGALLDGSYHDVDSSAMAFEVAAAMCIREGAKKARPILLEPVMTVEVVTPDESMGSIIGDLNARRGKVTGIDTLAGAQTIKSEVPLREMFGYSTALRSGSQGRATYTMEFSHYDAVPATLAAQIFNHGST